jgi:hypothetical protein
VENCTHCGSGDEPQTAQTFMQASFGGGGGGMVLQNQLLQMEVCPACGTVQRLWFPSAG